MIGSNGSGTGKQKTNDYYISNSVDVRSFYDLNYIYKTNIDHNGNDYCKQHLRYSIPQLIVKQWSNILLGEEPIVTIGDTSNTTEELEIDIKPVLSNVLAYGTTVLIPILVNGTMNYELLDLKDCEYVYDGDKLTYLMYKSIEKVIVNQEIEDKHFINEHFIAENGRYNISKKDQDGNLISIEEFDIDEVLCKIYKYKSNVYTGKPVYYDCINDIISYDDTMSDINRDRELSEKVIYYPQNMVQSSSARQEKGQYGVIPSDDRFRILPVGDKEDQKPIEWYGDFKVDDKMQYINYLLHMISMQSGFGAKYLSYDATTGGIKTAEEVISEKSDLYINKKNNDKLVVEIIKDLLFAKTFLEKDVKIEKQIIDVYCSDSIITNDEKKAQEFREDFLNGIIDQELVLDKLVELGRYKQDEVKKMISRAGMESNVLGLDVEDEVVESEELDVE
jgi:hypothetical protein